MDSLCYISWEVDGQQKIDASRYSNKTRRLCVEWENPDLGNSYLLKVAGSSAMYAKTFFGRHISGADITTRQRIGNWMNLCSGNHASTCECTRGVAFERLRESTHFGVIDVLEMRLGALPSGARYAALSYNWGQKQDDRFTTKLATVMQIRKRNGLTRFYGMIPKTIQDTIELVRNLKIRYVWIDSLCRCSTICLALREFY